MLSSKERQFKDMLEEALGGIQEFIPQYEIDGYYIDFYFPLLHLAVEYDEDNAVKEEALLQSDLVFSIIRVKEGEETEGLKNVLTYIQDHTVIVKDIFDLFEHLFS
jgi:very-short-patch-repair endonuclease